VKANGPRTKMHCVSVRRARSAWRTMISSHNSGFALSWRDQWLDVQVLEQFKMRAHGRAKVGKVAG
jgi:hypothetical protein